MGFAAQVIINKGKDHMCVSKPYPSKASMDLCSGLVSVNIRSYLIRHRKAKAPRLVPDPRLARRRLGCHVLPSMLPVPPMPVRPPASSASGTAKRARRAQLPQAFVFVTAHGSGRHTVHGVAAIEAAEQFACRAELEEQFHRLAERTGIIDVAEYVVWSLGTRCKLEGGPLDLEASDVKRSWGLVSEALTASGVDKVSAARLQVGSSLVTVAAFFRRARLRVWRLPNCESAELLFNASAEHLVTSRAYATQAHVTPSAPAPHDAAVAHDPAPHGACEEAEEDPAPHGACEDASHLHAYEFDVMLSAMRLSAFLKNADHITAAVKASLFVALGAEKAEELRTAIDDGSLRVPQKDALRNAWHKLDGVSILWEREQSKLSESTRYLMADSSTKLYNYLCVRERRIRTPRAGPAAGTALDPQQLHKSFENHAWPITVLGYGASNMAFKVRNIVHAAVIQCEGEAEWQRFRKSVLGWTSDQGTELKIADCALAVPANLANLSKVCADIQANVASLTAEPAIASYLWPRCLYMPGHMHLLFNALEEAVIKSPIWGGTFLVGLRGLLAFLNSKGLRQRFQAICLADASGFERSLFNNFSKQHLDWRWESLGQLLEALTPLLPVLLRRWRLASMQDGEDRFGSIDASCLHAVDTILKRKWLVANVEMLRVVAAIINRWASWMEGCSCHEAVWTAHTTYEQKRKRLREEYGIHECPWKGCRGDEMAAGGVSSWLHKVRTASSPALDLMLINIPAGDRAEIVNTMSDLKELLCEVLTAKLEMWRHLPYLLLGLGSWAAGLAKECAKKAEQEWHGSLQKNKASRPKSRPQPAGFYLLVFMCKAAVL